MKTAILLGSTGLIGAELTKLLQTSPLYGSVLLLNRRSSEHQHPKVSEKIIDFDAPNLAGITGDDLFCAFGTTQRKAGSRAAFERIDCDYPTTIATQLRQQGVARIFLVSSVGANAQAASVYLRTKGRLEENIIGLRFEQTTIVRPSFLIGRRTESRRGEEAAIMLLKLFSPLMVGPLRKYKGIEAGHVARGLVHEARAATPGVRFIESDQIKQLRDS